MRKQLKTRSFNATIEPILKELNSRLLAPSSEKIDGCYTRLLATNTSWKEKTNQRFTIQRNAQDIRSHKTKAIATSPSLHKTFREASSQHGLMDTNIRNTKRCRRSRTYIDNLRVNECDCKSNTGWDTNNYNGP